jgi:hypothetical protein
MSTEERLDRLTGIVESLGRPVSSIHDDQIADLIKVPENHQVAENHQKDMDEL